MIDSDLMRILQIVSQGLAISLLVSTSFDCRGKGDSIGGSPPTAQSLSQQLFKDLAANRPRSAVQNARSLIQDFPGTPEAQEAARLLPELEELERGLASEGLEPSVTDSIRGWHYAKSLDPMTDEPMTLARIESSSILRLGFPYEGEQRANLSLGLFRGIPLVNISIHEGQILCSSRSSCEIRIRIDDAPPENWLASLPSDGGSTSLTLSESRAFIERMRRATKVRAEIDLYREGSKVLHFDVTGFDHGRFLAGQ